MARKQSDYLAALLADEEATETQAETLAQPVTESPAEIEAPSPAPARAERLRGTTLLGRESALARVASGEVRQVTQLLLDPARVRVWKGNARSYEHLSEESCRELIDSLIAEGGQKVPAVVRRIDGDPDHDYEVIAGTRRHWSVSWLRANSYPQMQFVAQVAQLDDEAAFRLADLENRARKDVSDLERARNYAAALHDHYGSHLTRMAERLKLSKGWLSKMLKVASLPDQVLAAFASPADVQLKPAYPLAQALDDRSAAPAILREAKALAKVQDERRRMGDAAIPANEVIARLLAARTTDTERSGPVTYNSDFDRPALTLQSVNRQGVTLRLHSGSGMSLEELVELARCVLVDLEIEGRGLHR
ncbi:ParB/RepB/Spo0J family partition protein [Novosphingobium sp. ERN07]|uniref:ParB/RepB/Spo0J family partition protein n=1 Tax=Novosphingobium sp. ERN07 TaxID=2726187 RepID=UPI0014564239|nr:ParB/RepB/Spo0J family partition protein [Novosphingobium sp. ERN07]NLR70401.1 ParB/RepB/Spo0J family partition protein [Novosphingobium sp. ERN07]